ncbi:RNA-binding domain-containing protein [Thalassococcus lentus]|uniref:DNA binding domain-containing protein n=1 Tax=Thalassococcus lentus TaxID=1210524 RepID=A0ABT4XV81_9RHOB|nr:RNA-binding domain-containing protein [Thalassococcus lentus]MDA7425713.1 putative DNA binding domain-containing protein [Thalassococcus lentus]
MQAEDIKRKAFRFVRDTELGPVVLDLLIPQCVPLSFETELWDFKRKPPLLDEHPDVAARDLHKLEIHELIKDIASFHNSFGGYIVFGVEDSGAERVVGCSATLDLGDISKRFKSHTGRDIELFQNTLQVGEKNVLLLLVPRRKRSEEPIQFLKTGPSSETKKAAYQKGSIYIRRLDECRPAANSSEDWAFLFSDRIVSDSLTTSKKENIPSNLPPRDPDLVQFVGREDELTSLRSWVLDKRSPVRLISGIGGLGKTSVAYHFCEELAVSGAGDFEYIAWVSAKKTTYAALRGGLVKTTRHDFSTVYELLERLVILIAGESSVDDDAEEEELADILVDALKYRPSFIVVDDLDSLSPEEQRKCATVLQEIGFRTLDREHAGSKLLMTSRLDQGLSPTSVLKISGLDHDAFCLHIDNLCDQFGQPQFNLRLVKQVYTASSGSPLFASAIVRMASLGEPPKEVCETWASQDGEDVREFAFKRELDRLSKASASVLLAVVKLGEVSTEELLEAIEVSRRSLSDHINELQSFHLLGKKENEHGDIVLSTSKELIASAGILKSSLGQRAQEIERRCAIIRKNQGDQSREVGRTIRKIIKCLDEYEPDQALVLAKDLSKRNPRNGDAWCILARAFLSVQPPYYQQADDACTNAVKNSCSRAELFDYVIESKKGIGDWQGLKFYADKKRFKSKKRDPGLEAYLTAVFELVDLASQRGSYTDATRHAMDGVTKISDKVQNSYLESSFFNKLIIDQNRLADLAIKNTRLSVERPRDNLRVSDLGFELINLNVQTKGAVSAVFSGLSDWTNHVKQNDLLDEAEIDIISTNIRKLERLTDMLSQLSRDVSIELDQVATIQKQLGFLGASFS